MISENPRCPVCETTLQLHQQAGTGQQHWWCSECEEHIADPRFPEEPTDVILRRMGAPELPL